jgi:hypothetical protein
MKEMERSLSYLLKKSPPPAQHEKNKKGGLA